eukprot:296836_1
MSQWKVMWRKHDYILFSNKTTTINDFKQQLETYTKVKKSHIKFIGLKVKKEHRQQIQKIDNDTLLIFLQSRSKKKKMYFQMIGTPSKDIYDTFTVSQYKKYINPNLLTYSTPFRNMIYKIFQVSRVPNDIFASILEYINNNRFRFKTNYKATSITSKDGLCLRFIPNKLTCFTIDGPQFNSKEYISCYECRIKIIDLSQNSKINFFSSRPRYRDNWNIDNEVEELVKDTKGKPRYVESVCVSSYEMCGDPCSMKPISIQEYLDTYDDIKRIQKESKYWDEEQLQMFLNYNTDWKIIHKKWLNRWDVVHICVDFISEKIRIRNETNGYEFEKTLLDHSSPFQMSVKGGNTTIIILEQYESLY